MVFSIQDVCSSLNELGYADINDSNLEKYINEGAKSVNFTQIIEWVTKELQFLYSLDEHVNAISSPEDSSLFLMELSSFLREIGCQYTSIMEGRINDKLQSKANKILLLEYLLTELKSARMLFSNKLDNSLSITLNESGPASELKNMLIEMKFPKPPANIPPSSLFNKVQAKLKEMISKVPSSLVGEPLFTETLSDKDWHILEEFYKELTEEYKLRREMLLKRLDVTIQSFEWSDRLKNKSNEIHSSFETNRKLMAVEPNVKLSDILAARKDLAILEKTSSASVRRKTKSDVNKVLIGMVPDRGGRPYEQEPPPPEMPSWQQRNAGSGRGGGGGRGNFSNRGGGRGGGGGSNYGGDNFNKSSGGRGMDSGGRVQAGWNAPQHTGYQSSQNSSYDRNQSFDRNQFYDRNLSFERQNSGSSYSKDYHGQSSRGGEQYQYKNNSSYDNRGNRGGYRGGHQNSEFQDDYQDRRGYRGNQRGAGSRNYYRN